MKTIQAIAFDIDGTLYPNSFFYIHGIPSFLRHPVATRAYARMRVRVRELQAGGNRDPFRDLQIRLMAEELRAEPARAEAVLYERLYPSWRKWFSIARPFPGVRDVLEGLRDQGYPLAALSDFPLMGKLERLGLADVFPVQLSSEDIGFLKPHPAPFEALAAALKVPAESILYVGNSYRYDVIGSTAIGMTAAHLGEGGPQAHYSFKRYAEFPRL